MNANHIASDTDGEDAAVFACLSFDLVTWALVVRHQPPQIHSIINSTYGEGAGTSIPSSPALDLIFRALTQNMSQYFSDQQ